ncbi:MAG: ATP-dependent Clp protease ATP-binding subunit [Planctomycetes bacterium]|nr:ATP-dependent Clp protease ATP-binding subunit [Planctomycetota bacterium]
MKTLLPVYVEQRWARGARDPHFVVRPLFLPEPEARHENLGHALARLERELHRVLGRLARDGDAVEEAKYSFAPSVTEQLAELPFDEDGRTVRHRFLLVELEALGSRVAFTPALPETWFLLDRGQDLRERAAEVLGAHFRRLAREDRDWAARPGELALRGKAWLTSLELQLPPTSPKRDAPPDDLFARLGGGGKLHGAAELDRVGRCLDWLYPDELDRAVLREREVEELMRLLEEKDRRPVLLLGPPGVGKTAILHECVHRWCESKRDARRGRRATWLLSPQRLISGMSYVGQWENRLLAILDEAKSRDLVLYFDDLLGMYHAGTHSRSQLGAAHLLKPRVERREVRVLAELTPEAYRVFQERDRGFADLFHVLPVRETSEDDTWRVLLRTERDLERARRCRFALECLPVVVDLTRRYGPDAAFPGKAAALLKRLAMKHQGGPVERETVLDEFHELSGLPRTFLDARTRLTRAEVLAALGARIIGQEGALAAAADVIAVARARLNDPSRPLASFLFLGPTGVGKTQCAKGIAAYLFADEERLVRFDMNEFVDAGSVARLTGTFEEPEGLLTGAIRQRPFSVVLFDEIEKAHPRVFDVLLAVLGEGRLTDARGRTADFTRSILILTSNLGVREAAAAPGFRTEEAAASDAAVYVRAAERFFRPEFVNRLDRIVPFSPLGRGEVERIAQVHIADLFGREGLVRRRCVLDLHPAAMERIVEEGYHPLLGARALKRSLERRLAQPVAERLAVLPPDTPTVIAVYARGAGLAVHVTGLVAEAAVARAPGARPEEAGGEREERMLGRLDALLEQLGCDLARHRPTGALGSASIRPEDYHYFALRDRLRRVRERLDRRKERVAGGRRGPARGVRGGAMRKPSLRLFAMEPALARRGWKDFVDLAEAECAAAGAQAAGAGAADAAAGAPPAMLRPDADDPVADLLRETALLRAMSEALGTERASAAGSRRPRGDAADQPQGQAVVLHLQTLEAGGRDSRAWLRDAYLGLTGETLGLDLGNPDSLRGLAGERDEFLVVEGGHANALFRGEEGTHVFWKEGGRFVLVQVRVLTLRGDASPARAAEEQLRRRHEWMALLTAGRAEVESDPFPLLPVLRTYDERKRALDLRAGLLTPGELGAAELRAMLLARLPSPLAEEDVDAK